MHGFTWWVSRLNAEAAEVAVEIVVDLAVEVVADVEVAAEQEVVVEPAVVEEGVRFS